VIDKFVIKKVDQTSGYVLHVFKDNSRYPFHSEEWVDLDSVFTRIRWFSENQNQMEAS